MTCAAIAAANVEGTIEELRETYRVASNSQRKVILNHCRKSMSGKMPSYVHFENMQ